MTNIGIAMHLERIERELRAMIPDEPERNDLAESLDEAAISVHQVRNKVWLQNKNAA